MDISDSVPVLLINVICIQLSNLYTVVPVMFYICFNQSCICLYFMSIHQLHIVVWLLRVKIDVDIN